MWAASHREAFIPGRVFPLVSSLSPFYLYSTAETHVQNEIATRRNWNGIDEDATKKHCHYLNPVSTLQVLLRGTMEFTFR